MLVLLLLLLYVNFKCLLWNPNMNHATPRHTKNSITLPWQVPSKERKHAVYSKPELTDTHNAHLWPTTGFLHSLCCSFDYRIHTPFISISFLYSFNFSKTSSSLSFNKVMKRLFCGIKSGTYFWQLFLVFVFVLFLLKYSSTINKILPNSIYSYRVR